VFVEKLFAVSGDYVVGAPANLIPVLFGIKLVFAPFLHKFIEKTAVGLYVGKKIFKLFYRIYHNFSVVFFFTACDLKHGSEVHRADIRRNRIFLLGIKCILPSGKMANHLNHIFVVDGVAAVFSAHLSVVVSGKRVDIGT